MISLIWFIVGFAACFVILKRENYRKMTIPVWKDSFGVLSGIFWDPMDAYNNMKNKQVENG